MQCIGQLYKTMGIFDNLKIYGEKWQKVSERNFTSEEVKEVRDAIVVASTYGMSVCFMLNAGQTYIPVATECDDLVRSGDRLDIAKCKLITLSKQGEADIIRVELDADSIL